MPNETQVVLLEVEIAEGIASFTPRVSFLLLRLPIVFPFHSFPSPSLLCFPLALLCLSHFPLGAWGSPVRHRTCHSPTMGFEQGFLKGEAHMRPLILAGV